jgi:DNA repair exonuclease SbcCD ATPase subunit
VTTADSSFSTIAGKNDDAIELAPVNPRARRISPSDVFQAADTLLQEGHRPTIDRVRMRLGRGSPNTIQEHLDVWWSHLGSRLRDIPGREFPDLPERVGHALQALWNTALDSAHEALGETASTREHFIAERVAAVDEREKQSLEQERLAMARASALEESLGLARDQLLAANRRADQLEISLRGAEDERARLRKRIDALEAEATDFRSKLDATVSANRSERAMLDKRHAATEAHWLEEVDRARLAAKEIAKEQERRGKELRAQIGQMQTQRDELKQGLQEAQSELRTARIMRTQLEKKLAAVARVPGTAKVRSKPGDPRKRQ